MNSVAATTNFSLHQTGVAASPVGNSRAAAIGAFLQQ